MKNKHKQNKIKTTIDKLHTDKITELQNSYNELPKLKIKLVELHNEYNNLLNINLSEINNDIITRKSYLQDEINSISEQINNLSNPHDILLYLDNTRDIIDEYYFNKNNNINKPPTKNILSYFTNLQQPQPVTENIDTNNTSSLYNKYLNITTCNYNNKINQYQCSDCNGDKIISHDGYYVCKQCGLRDNSPIIHDKPCYNDTSYEVSTYAYKRINHLKEILSQLQAKETTEIPSSVYDKINNELIKKNINKYNLGIFELRKILKKIKLHKYYEHSAHILQMINGTIPPVLTRQQEYQIIKNFKDIQIPYTLYCPKERKNFLNYNFYLHKICQLHGLYDLIKYFPLLKNNEKLKHHDKIWKKMCKHLNWVFHPSI